jgi:DNA-binding LacI/PurR family transcriptional regulator
MPEKTLTIYDIAKEAGVSPATVSRVLTQKAKVSPEKKKSVEKIIEKYNFQPNALARSLSDTRTKILGIIAADIRNPYYAALVVECEIAANKLGYTVMVCNVFDDDELEDSRLEKMYAQRVDAIIQLGCRTDALVSDAGYAARVNRICATVPFLTTGKLDGVSFYRVAIDHVEAMRQVFDYLVSLGHTDIALI